jgi:predicted nucleic acid-binding protein
MIHFLVDSSAVWRLQRQPELTKTWTHALLSGAIGSCEPQRAEFRRSARNEDELDQMNHMFRDTYPDVPVPKSVWRWVDSAQHRLAGAGAVRALSVVDLLICGTAAPRDLLILHDDADYELAARHLPDVRTRRIVGAAR